MAPPGAVARSASRLTRARTTAGRSQPAKPAQRRTLPALLRCVGLTPADHIGRFAVAARGPRFAVRLACPRSTAPLAELRSVARLCRASKTGSAASCSGGLLAGPQQRQRSQWRGRMQSLARGGWALAPPTHRNGLSNIGSHPPDHPHHRSNYARPVKAKRLRRPRSARSLDRPHPCLISGG